MLEWVLPGYVGFFLKKNFVVKFFLLLASVYFSYVFISHFMMAVSIREASSYFYAKDYPKAFEKIFPHAMDGDAESRYQVGIMYAFGLGVSKDKMLALSWFNCSDISGCIKGRNEFRAAVSCFAGEWGVRSRDECLLWMKFSSDHGYQNAILWLDQNAKSSAQ